MLSDAKIRRVEGIITNVRRYGNGVVFLVGKGSKVFVSRELIREYVGDDDFENLVYLAGTTLRAEGKRISWYGGEIRCYIEAHNVSFEPVSLNLSYFTTEEKIDRIKKILQAVNPSRTKEIKIKNDTLKRILIDPSYVFSLKDLSFPCALSIYKLLTGGIYLPLNAIAKVCRFFVKEAYEDEGRLVVSIDEIVKRTKEFFIAIEDQKDIITCIRKKNSGIFLIRKEDENGQANFLITTWEIRQMLFYVVKYVCESARLGLSEEDIKKFVYDILKCGKLDLEKNGFLSVKMMSSEFLFEFLKEKGIVAVVGSGGAGKTTLLRNFASYLKGLGKEVLCCALTGSASAELSPFGRTIQLILHRGIPDVVDYVLVDESSMVDLITFYKLVKRLNGQKLLLVGDPEQNPPPRGFDLFQNVLVPLLSKSEAVIRLKSLYRFANKRLVFVPYHSESSLEKILESVVKKIEGKWSWLFITPYHHIKISTRKLTFIAKKILGKTPGIIEIGDRVMFLENIKINNRVIIPNRNFGVVRKIDSDREEVEVETIVGSEKYVLRVKNSKVAHAYALEFYSSQGKEVDFSFVFIPDLVLLDESDFQRKWNVVSTRARKLTMIFIPAKCIFNSKVQALKKREREEGSEVHVVGSTDELLKIVESSM